MKLGGTRFFSLGPLSCGLYRLQYGHVSVEVFIGPRALGVSACLWRWAVDIELRWRW